MMNFIFCVAVASIFGLGVVTALSWGFNQLHLGYHAMSRKLRRSRHKASA